MNGLLDEIEIKIEYNDIYEDDPLARRPRRTRLNCTSQNQDADNTFDDPIEAQYEQNNLQLNLQSYQSETGKLNELTNNETIKVDLPNTKIIDYDECNPEIVNSKTKSTIKDETATWYKDLTKDGKVCCRFCSLSYSVVQTLRYHMRTKHPKEAVVLKAAIAKGNRSQKLLCHICSTKCSSVEELKKHVAVKHNIDNNDKFVCDYCQLLFYDKNNLDGHILKKHIDSKGKFSTVINEKLGFNKTERKFPCPHCSHVAKRKYGLNTHIKARHRSEDDLIFICPFCPYKAAIKYYLQNHVAKQHPESEYAQTKVTHFCDVCGYRTPKKSHFLEHRRSHFCTAKKHKCEFCDYGANLIANLEVHRRTHTKEKPFMCDIDGCEYRCGAKTALNSHKLKHYPEKYALYCDKCSYTTIYRHALKKHIDSHGRNTVLKTYRIGFKVHPNVCC